MALKVMIVDDEPAVLQVLKDLMGPAGFAVSAFTDSQEAAARVEKEKFDAVFVDVRMPGMDGFELTRRIRASRSNSKTPIVMCTGHDDVETMRRGFQAGITFFLGKPFTVEKVRGLLTVTRGAMLNEKRRYARLPLRAGVNCQAGGKRFRSGSLNISDAGMLLENPGRVAVGQEVELEFMLPQTRQSLRLRARVVRLEDPNYMGVQFIDLAPEERAAIQSYISGFVKG
jgi:CheY-like chemotaxis protein